MLARQLLTLGAIVLSMCAAAPLSTSPDWQGVDQALGRPGAEQPDGVRRYSFPRSDLRVTLDGVALKPGLAFGSWLAFQPMGNEVMLMGDLVLLQEEVNPVMSRLLDAGLTVTALHNHLMRSSPGTMYMHIHGHGNAVALASAVRAALALSHTPLGAPAAATQEPTAGFDAAAVDRILGARGRLNGSIYQFSIPRRERITEAGVPVPPSMGLATAINIQPLANGRAVTSGDFVLLASEVTPVLRALRANSIEVTALHNHLGQEQPRLFFMHFWGNGDAAALARGLRQALDRTGVRLQP